jgi:8-oxo-dGTP pyrophosphatase MutT (NUDIX family)
MGEIEERARDPHPSWVREGDGAHDETIEANWLFRLRRERFRSRRTGRAHDYYVMHLADAVNVIALTPDERIVLVRQFRAGSGRDSLEPPGGLLEPGEDPCEAGARELLEETGYAGDPAVLVGQAWSNPSIMTSKIATVLVTNACPVAPPKLDDNEEVALELVPARLIPRMILDGRIDHALSVMGLLWWMQFGPGGRGPWHPSGDDGGGRVVDEPRADP